MNELQIFENSEFGTVRTVDINGEIYFVGKDVTEILGYQNSSKALADHVDDDDKLNNESLSSIGQRGGWLINESGLYSLIISSKMPKAKKFKHWVTSEVLPSIRKNGVYMTDEKAIDLVTNPQSLISLLEQAAEQLKQKDIRIEEMRPKEIFADAVTSSKTSILVGELAKIIRQNGYETGEKRLFEQLRREGYLISRKGTDYNMPTQRSMELGLFEIKETAVTHADGHTTVSKTPKVTGKGQQYFINKFLGEEIVGQLRFT